MFSSKLKNLWNFGHFHRKRVIIACTFTTTYFYLCKKGQSLENEYLRMGVAGSFANLAVEGGFHFLDTVNVRAKTSE
jgi:hypothetical protein